MHDVHLDGIIYSLQKNGGITSYFNSLLQCERRLKTIITVEKNFNDENLIPVNLHLFEKERLFERFRNCRSLNAKVFHSSYYRISDDSKTKNIVTVHDLIYEKFFSGIKKIIHINQKKKSLNHASKIICVSNSTKNDLIQFYNTNISSIVVIPNGVSENFKLIKNIVSSDSYIIYIGSRAFYKNFKVVIEALKINKNIDLYIIGGGVLNIYEIKLIETIGFERVKILPTVNEYELNILYNNAVALIYPSLYEGFGIPVLEAFRARCPVIVGNCKAIMEFGSENLMVSWSGNAYEYADLINKAYKNNKIKLTESGYYMSLNYSWQKTKKMTYDIYESFL